MMIYKAGHSDAQAAAEMAILMWGSHTVEELTEDMATVIDSPEGAVFLAREGEEFIGFAQCQLRNDYVEGTESSPVGYLEGILVREEYRHQGYARALLERCQQWAKEQGCSEFASDCELDNEESHRFHMKVGFEEANRVICFIKQLNN